MKVAFLHPDLGLGGAERLVVDAAVELVHHGHSVDMFTAFYDRRRCFEETQSGIFNVIVAGSWFPRHILGRCLALCAYIRCILVALHIAWGHKVQYDVIIVDQVSAVIPVLKLLTSSRILFYCHFPDMLLAERRSAIKRMYRAPLDWVEQHTTGQADLVLVNSRFTAGIFASTFQRLAKRKLEPQVLYPAVAVPAASTLLAAQAGWREVLGAELAAWAQGGPLLLSINRFERKKGIALAVLALKELHAGGSDSSSGSSSATDAATAASLGVRLVLAGGYDSRLPENVEHFEELQQLVRELGLQEEVRFLPSFTDKQRSALLAACTAVIYTPQHEHFGIVPLEAMVAGRPVLAANSGGPTESVVHGVTGFLCDPTPSAFASAARQLLAQGGAKAHSMGKAARAHVVDRFSRAAFGKQLDSYIKGLVNQGEAPRAG
ncbi:hypothetical protein QJQ45_011463 [Haematococcus lacustris]|nr:hypothetical protein QJQ45_011463 [Haematococcus lacustris]